MPGRSIVAKYSGKCRTCGGPIVKDETRVYWVDGVKGVQCVPCSKASPTPAPPRERPGAHLKSLPIDVLARELPDRVWCLLNDTPRPGDDADHIVADLGRVLTEYALSFKKSTLGGQDPEG